MVNVMDEDELYERYAELADEIRELVSIRLEIYSDEDAEQIRDWLQEQFRFWKELEDDS
jgi:hypothetical protein